MEIFLVVALLLLHRKPEPLPCLFSNPIDLGPLKMHTIGEVDLSYSLRIVDGEFPST
jgi:hypothetical protein